jgi:hypothetical protein
VVATPVPVPVPVPVPNTRVVETTRVVPGPTTAEVLENADDIEVEVHGRSFNRWVATLVIDGRDLAEVLIQAGHGAPCKG